jgi:hypothetical protein
MESLIRKESKGKKRLKANKKKRKVWLNSKKIP